MRRDPPVSGRSRHDGVDAQAAFVEFVGGPGFSCLAGKGVVNANGYELGVYGELGSRRSARRLAGDLKRFTAMIRETDGWMNAFVAVFPARMPSTEHDFEARLWTQLQVLSDTETGTTPWDDSVSDDPDDPRFSFSFAKCAMFVVGMHPASSRLARRFSYPTLVFNPRAQFDRLRETGRFERLRQVVREREVAIQGSINPNLADFGEASDARQYSGRATEPGWQCPFHHRAP